MEVTGESESFVLLQVWGVPANAPDLPLGNLGTHALVFTGRADIVGLAGTSVKDMIDDLEDSDQPFTWDLDITVGPKWRSVKQVAPLVVVEDFYSWNIDEDDELEAAVEFRSPKWSVPVTEPLRIVLHVRVKQAGEHLRIHSLAYNVTATGELRDVSDFIPAD
jgi:hypothetical protein